MEGWLVQVLGPVLCGLLSVKATKAENTQSVALPGAKDDSRKAVDYLPQPSHGCVWTQAMHVQTKLLRLYKPVSLGDRLDDWRVCWLGGWDKCRVFFVVMVEREFEQPVAPCTAPSKKRTKPFTRLESVSTGAALVVVRVEAPRTSPAGRSRPDRRVASIK